MSSDPLQKRATPARVWSLFRADVLPISFFSRAETLIGRTPSSERWLIYMDRLLIILGAGLLVAGIFFFFAFNWADLPRLARFGLVQVLLIGATMAAWVLKLDSWPGRVALASATLLVGALLAVVGQSYQTGADSWRLFYFWTLFIIPWVLLSRWNATWLIGVILANVTFSLFWEQEVSRYETLLFNLIVLGGNLGFMLAWDLAAKFTANAGQAWEFLQERWHQGLVAAAVLSAATVFFQDALYNYGWNYLALEEYAIPIYVFIVSLLFFFYIRVEQDLFIVTATCVSVLVAIVSVVMRVLVEVNFFNESGSLIISFLFLGLLTVGLTYSMVRFVQNLQSKWENDSFGGTA